MANRKELLSTIEQQRDQISKYENKFKGIYFFYYIFHTVTTVCVFDNNFT